MAGSAVGLVSVTLYETLQSTDDGLALTTLFIFRDTGSVIVSVAAGAYVVSEVSIVISEKFLNSQYAKGKADGKVEGESKAHKRWVNWNKERQAAERRGEEPPVPPTTDE